MKKTNIVLELLKTTPVKWVVGAALLMIVIVFLKKQLSGLKISAEAVSPLLEKANPHAAKKAAQA